MISLYREKLLQAAAFRIMGTDSASELKRIYTMADQLAAKIATGEITLEQAEWRIK